MALLLPDPADSHCPNEFKQAARRVLLHHPVRPERWETEVKSDEGLRHVLLQFIGELADWENASSAAFLRAARDLVQAAHGSQIPLVVDPFSGGGAIPLEALRLGCDACATDLNPVAGLILRSLLEDLPRQGADLPDALAQIGQHIRSTTSTDLASFYPPDSDGAKPITYLWARSVRCESPQCGAEIPLMRSLWLCKKATRRAALRFQVVRPEDGIPRVDFEMFEPRREGEVPPGTVSRAKATCPCCGMTLTPERVRAQLGEQRGGADVVFDKAGVRSGGARLLAVVVLRPGGVGRQYRLPTASDYVPVFRAQQVAVQMLTDWEAGGRIGPPPIPLEPLPWKHGHRSIQSPRVYGMRTWSDYFTSRQLVTLTSFSRAVRDHAANGEAHGPTRDLLALVLSKFAELSCANCRWEPVAECPRSIFTRHDLPATWDFAEGVPVSSSSGSFGQTLDNVVSTLRKIGSNWRVGQVQQADARQSPLPNDSAAVWFTDPPYYDAVAYADLSDFFFVWLKRCLPNHPLLKDPFDPTNPLVPKRQELTVTTASGEQGPSKTRADFENGVCESFAEGSRVIDESGVGCVVFAHKTTEGWEALLSGMLRAGWIIRTSWPVATEMAHRFNARDVAALATSIHLVCRPRPLDAPVGDWGDVLRELPRRVAEWMERLQGEGIRGADLVFACIGPALEIYSRYSKVVDPQEREIPLGGDPEAREPHLRGYLAYVWEVVGRAALNQVLGTAEASARNGAAGALEEDARLTALFLWTLQATAVEDDDDSTQDADADQDEGEEDDAESGGAGKKKSKGFSLIFDVARRFAQPLGIHMEAWEKRIIETDKGVVRLLPVLERAEQLFGEDGASAVADRLEKPGGAAAAQGLLFPQPEEPPRVRGRRGRANVPDEALRSKREATTLDRVHAAMLLQASGRANALRALLKAELERGPDFLRLANALSALYPQGSDEKRLVDAMLLAVPR